MEALEVLHPLEVGYGDAAGVAQDVGDDENIAAGVEDFVGIRGGGAVGTFREDFAAESGGIVAGDHAVERTRGENVARLGDDLSGVDGFGSGKSGDAAVFADVVLEFAGIDAARVPDRAVGVGDASDFDAV